MKRNMEARLSVLNAATGALELPVGVVDSAIRDNWDYRNYNDDWLLSWEELKSKLISSWKARGFSEPMKESKKLPVMLTPGFGTNPKTQCFGCAEFGHRRGNSQCKAPEGSWAACTPPRFRERATAGVPAGRKNMANGQLW